jgi:hypothetical protein
LAANRKRIALVVAVALLTIWNGQLVIISYFFSPILDNIGVKSTTKQTGINSGMQIWNLLWAIAGAVLADRVGRRTLWRTFVSLHDPRQCSANHLLCHLRPTRLQARGVFGDCILVLLQCFVQYCE